jgi:hypothetical protein
MAALLLTFGRIGQPFLMEYQYRPPHTHVPYGRLQCRVV